MSSLVNEDWTHCQHFDPNNLIIIEGAMPMRRDPKQGWTDVPVNEFEIVNGVELLKDDIYVRVRGLHESICSKLSEGFAVRGLPNSRAGCLRLLIDPVLSFLLEFTNENLQSTNKVTPIEMRRFLSTMLLLALDKRSPARSCSHAFAP